MNTAILSNPAPSNGYDAVLGAMAAQAAPAEGSLGNFNASVHNRVKQTFVNPVATYPFIVRPWKQRWEQGFHTGDLMFIWKGVDKAVTSKTVILANLPVLNRIFSTNATADEGTRNFQRPKDWRYIGVMRNSAVASGRVAQPHSGRGGNQRAAERIINIDVRGSTRMFNYWENASPGEHLHLVWRDVELNSRQFKDFKPNGSAPGRPGPVEGWRMRMRMDGNEVYEKMELQADGTLGLTRTVNTLAELQVVDPRAELPVRTVKQLLPYTDGRNYGQDDIWWNKQAIRTREMSNPICVGWVFQGIGAGERSDHALAIRRATQLDEDRFKLPILHSFLNV